MEFDFNVFQAYYIKTTQKLLHPTPMEGCYAMYYIEENDLYLRQGSIRYYDLEEINSYEIFFVSIQFFKAKQDFTFRRHCHPAYEIIIPRSGDYKCLINGQELSVEVGELLLVQEGDWHQDILRDDTEFTVITFAINNPEKRDNSNPDNANVKRKLFKDKTAAINQKITSPCDELSTSLLKLLAATGTAENDSSTYYVLDGIFHALFWKIIFLFPEEQLAPGFVKNMSNESAKQQLLRIFEKNIHAKMDIPQLAGCMNMSESQLAHKCKEIIGESPARAFARYKLKRAETYLKDSHTAIKQISDMLGFDDQFHFSRTFKRFYGISPAVYRKKH